MSIIQPAVRPLQVFFRSAPTPCPYLPGRFESKLFTRIAGPGAAEANSVLSRAGFRRSHDIVYRPVCVGCAACVPVRIPVARFAPQRTLRRIARVNADLALSEVSAAPTSEQFRLFHAYQQSRHGDSDMARMTLADFCAMLDEGRADTSMFELRDGDGRLAGAMLTDRIEDGFSAVYSFYDPALDRRSLGTYLVLAMVERARAEGLANVYLGYWIEGSRKMAYKARFRPLEALGPGGWAPLEASSGAVPED
jgi:arginine-tRNA-protein transferase